MSMHEKQRSLDEWLQWLEVLHPSTIELGLDRVDAVAERLGLDFSKQKVIIVGGTNGKGSSIAMLSGILQAAGYTVGAYTSPHLLVYNERVTCNQVMASDAELCAAFSQIEEVRAGVSLTYFEYGTLAALVYFQTIQPDVILLEVGLGGRLDAVNIVEPDISILTNVALDHMDWLGDTRDAIGREKAGIFRTGKPAIYGESSMPDSVLAYANEIGARLLHKGREFHFQQRAEHWDWQGLNALGEAVTLTNLPVNDFPLDNAAAVIQGLYLLDVSLQPEHIAEGIKNAHVSGRFQELMYQGTKVILDVAHNPHAAANLAGKLQKLAVDNKIFMVLAMLGDKDSDSVVKLLSPHVHELFVCGLGGERGASVKIIYNQALEAGARNISCHEGVKQAFLAALASAGTDGLVIVTGSFFTVAAVLEFI